MTGPHPSRRILVERCGSTNDLAREMALEGAQHGSWVSAKVQDQGRGRAGRSWLSFEGNLFFSMIARIDRRELWSWIPLAAGVASREALLSLSPALDVRLKWPNDLWIGPPFAKAGGILCEGSAGAHEHFVIVGIGINCARAPEDIDQPAACCEISDLDRLRETLEQRLMANFALLSDRGGESIARKFESAALFQHRDAVEWGAGHGVVLGLGPSGELRVWDEVQNEERWLLAEDVKLRPHRRS